MQQILPEISPVKCLLLQMYLVSALFLFSLPHLIPEFPQSTAYPYLVMLFLPLGHIGMVRMCNIASAVNG